LGRAATRIGAGGEFLACAILAELGWTASPVNADGFDLMVTRGPAMVRVQVKSTLKVPAGHHCYKWSVSGGNPKRSLTRDDCDIVAAMALDTRRAYFLPVESVGKQLSLALSARKIAAPNFEKETWEAALRATPQKT